MPAAYRARHLFHVIPSFSIGGVPVRLGRIINHFGDRYRHTVLALDGRLGARERVDPRLPVEFVPYSAVKAGLMASLLRSRDDLRAAHPDLLITYNWGAIDWAMANLLFKICPHIHQEDGFGVEEANGQFLRRIVYRRLALATTRVVVVPSRSLEKIALSSWRVPRRKVLYLPNGIDVARFADATPSPLVAARRGAGGLLVGTVAPLRPEKNLARLVRAFASLSGSVPARLLIAGDGSQREPLERLVGELGLGDRVIFLGNVTDPQSVLKSIDVFAISSDTEQMPTTVLEAMASGLPIAAVDVGDIRDMVASENVRFVVSKDQPDAFRAAIETLLEQAGTRAALGRANQLKVRQSYSQEAMFAGYDRIFSS